MDKYRDAIPNYGYLMTVQEFREECKRGSFADDDGYGKFVKNCKMNPDVKVYSSTTRYPLSATHVVWFNK